MSDPHSHRSVPGSTSPGTPSLTARSAAAAMRRTSAQQRRWKTSGTSSSNGCGRSPGGRVQPRKANGSAIRWRPTIGCSHHPQRDTPVDPYRHPARCAVRLPSRWHRFTHSFGRGGWAGVFLSRQNVTPNPSKPVDTPSFRNLTVWSRLGDCLRMVNGSQR